MIAKVDTLVEMALNLRRLLELYGQSDADVKEAYEWIQPLLDSVAKGEVVGPKRFLYGWIFFRGENSLPAYPDLMGAAADFANALEAS